MLVLILPIISYYYYNVFTQLNSIERSFNHIITKTTTLLRQIYFVNQFQTEEKF